MKLQRSLATCSIICFSVFAACAQFQVVHDTPLANALIAPTPLILTDGSTVTYHLSDGHPIFRKYDGDGGLLWTKFLEADPQTTWGYGDGWSSRMVSDGAEGFYFACHAYSTNTPTGDPMMYDHDRYYHIVHVDGDGEVLSSRRLKKSYMIWDQIGESQHGIDLERTPDDGLVLSSTIHGIFKWTDVVKIDANGAVGWSRCVGHASADPTGPSPAFVHDVQGRGRLAVSNSGTVFYMEAGDGPLEHLRLFALDANGDLLWAKHHVYDGTISYIAYRDIAVDAGGKVHALGVMSTSVGNYQIVLRSAEDGTLDRGDLYRTPTTYVNADFFRVDAQGRRWNGGEGVIVSDTLGNPAQHLERADQVILPNNVFVETLGLDVSGGRLALSGRLNHEHVDLAYTTRHETLASIDTDDLSACLMNDTVLTHVAIPLEIVAQEDLLNAGAIDVSAYYSIAPSTLTMTDLDPEPMDGICAFASEILGVNIGMEERDNTERTPMVLNSFVAQGSPIHLNDPAAYAVTVYDVHGALVQRSALNASRTVPTSGWSTGVYILHALDGQGTPLRAGKVVLE
ncbi:MAG: T9SS type A sorting domain-containing protein [Flavobacteriales bacterium]|nr:T9SS type A sorting domain-containing protein [Flavobacteriales bacterium]